MLLVVKTISNNNGQRTFFCYPGICNLLDNLVALCYEECKGTYDSKWVRSLEWNWPKNKLRIVCPFMRL